jgi:outer membrane autotransporter protein
MLRPKSVVSPRVTAIIVPLAFALTFGVSSEALAACSEGSPYSGTNSVTCDGANDLFQVNDPANFGSLSTDGGNDNVQVTGGKIGTISAGDGNDFVYVKGGQVTGNIEGGSGNDNIRVNSGIVHDIYGGDGSDRIDINPGEIAGSFARLEGTEINGGSGNDRIRLVGAANLEEDETNIFINPNLAFIGGDDAGVIDQFIVEDDSEVRFGNELRGFETLSVQEESIAVLTRNSYAFTNSITVTEGAQLWFENKNSTITTGQINIAAGAGIEELQVGSQYAAFDPGNMLMFGAFPAEEEGDDDDAPPPGSPVTATVNITANTLNNGTLGTFNGVVGDKVTFTGGGYQSVGDVGKFAIDTKLGGTGSATDTLNFDKTKDFLGMTTVYVNNVGGKGAYTGHGATDGILIATGPTNFAANNLQLGANALSGQQELFAGAFSYRLVGNGNNALLQSDLLDQVPAYTIVSSVAQKFSTSELGTLYKRMGEVRLGHGDGQTYGGNANGGAWVRGHYSDYDVSPNAGFGFSQQNDGVMGGADVGFRTEGGRFFGGVFGGYGTAQADTSANIWGSNIASNVDLKAYSFGAYGTYYESGHPGTGLYVDAVMKGNIFDYNMEAASRSVTASTDGYAGTVSGETGYGFGLGGNLILQPQAQLTYTTVTNKNYSDSYGVKVGNEYAESLVGRASLQLQANYGSGSSGWVTPYIIGSVLSDFFGDNHTIVGATDFRNDVGLTWFEAGGGVTAELSNSISLYGSAEYSFGDVQGWGGTGGVKARW